MSFNKQFYYDNFVQTLFLDHTCTSL